MKASAELGIATLQLQRRARGPRVKAKASFVDETLFGSSAGRQVQAAEFDPPWVESKTPSPRPLLWSPEVGASPAKGPSSAGTPRKRNKYRLKSHTPSYCDETLFGPKPGEQEWAAPWMSGSDVAKLRPLLLTPPSALRDRLVLSPHPKETPLRAVHQEKGKEGAGSLCRREDAFRRPQESGSDRTNQDDLRRRRSCSLTRVCSASDRAPSLANNSRTNMWQNKPLPVTSTGSFARPCSQGFSVSTKATRSTSSCKPKPPWK